MSEHLSPSSGSFWGVLAQVNGWRLIVQPLGGYALQSANGADFWETLEAFPTAGWLCAHVHGVYPVPDSLAAAADLLPEEPPRGKAERLSVLRRLRESGLA